MHSDQKKMNQSYIRTAASTALTGHKQALAHGVDGERLRRIKLMYLLYPAAVAAKHLNAVITRVSHVQAAMERGNRLGKSEFTGSAALGAAASNGTYKCAVECTDHQSVSVVIHQERLTVQKRNARTMAHHDIPRRVPEKHAVWCIDLSVCVPTNPHGAIRSARQAEASGWSGYRVPLQIDTKQQACRALRCSRFVHQVLDDQADDISREGQQRIGQGLTQRAAKK